MDLISKLLSFNNIVFNTAVGLHRFIYKIKPGLWGIRRKMKKYPKLGVNTNLYIILNGPSLKTQNLLSLKGKCLLFVNRGFLHPAYRELQPDYHIFVDSKLRDGVWPLEWLEQIFSMSPNTKIILPVEWYDHPTFKNYKNDNRIIWQCWHVPIYCLGVSGACFSFGIENQFNSIYFTGFDANGCACDMINSSKSHFYGGDPELSSMTTIQHAKAMCSTAIHFVDLNRLAKYCRNKGVKVYNITNGGLLDMFERKRIVAEV